MHDLRVKGKSRRIWPYSRVVMVAILSAIVLPGLALLGYATGLRILAQSVPFGTAMTPGTAVALILAGIGLWLLAAPTGPLVRRRAGQALGLLVALYGGFVLVGYATGRNLGTDALLFADRTRAWSTADLPGLPSPYTAIALVVTGLALALLDADAKGRYRPAQVLAPAGGLVACVALLGDAYGLAYLSSASRMNSMAFSTAATISVLSVGLLACRPDRAWAQAFMGGGPSRVAWRRLAPIALVLVLLAGMLLTAIGRRDLPQEQAAVVTAIALLVLMLYLGFLSTGKALNKADRLVRSEHDFSRMVLNSLREGVLIAEADGTVQEVSPRWCEITGYSAQRVIGSRPPYPWWPPEQVTELQAKCSVALSADHVMEYEMVIRRHDGTDVAVLATVSPVIDPTSRRIVVSYRDLTEHNQAEADRRRAAEQLSHFFAISTDLLCIAGSDGYFKYLNPAWESTLGHTTEELKARPFVEFVHPDDVARTADESARQVAAGTASVSFENRYRCRDGSYRSLSWNAIPVARDQLVYAVARDNTDRRSADEAQSWLSAFVEGTLDAIIGKTLDGTIVSWNPAAERQYGYTADEAIGQSIRLIVPPDREPEIVEILDKIASGEQVRLHDTVRVRKDGTHLHVAASISPVNDRAGIVGAASISRDITDRIKAEELFQRLILAAPDAMLIADQNGTIILVNEQTERLFGYPRKDLLGQPVEMLVPEQARHLHADHRRTYHAAPQIRRMGVGLELAGQRRDGTQFPVEISLAPLDTEQGMLVSVAIRDTTERQQVEQALAHARDEALATAQLKSQFVAMVSHEIRTPMNGVIGLTNLLLQTPLQPGPRRYAQAIRTSGQALLTIINDILDFSKIEAGKIKLVNVDFPLDQFLEEIVQGTAESAHGKDIDVRAYYSPALPIALRGDAGRLRQALLNLLSNAVKFTEHGTVTVRAELDTAASDGRPRITFSVSDTGIGIGTEDLAGLFEPFTQVDAASNREFGGTGLGLTITRQLVELMDGRLDVESQPGRGSRFSFTIPVTPTQAPAARKLFQHQIAGRKLLVVDADPASRSLITEYARSWGMTLTEAPDSSTALDCLHHAARHRQAFDVVIIDQHMPGGDGIELTDKINSDPAIPPISIVLITSDSPVDKKTAPFPTGVTALLAKPADPSQLFSCLLSVLNPKDAEVGKPPQPLPAPVGATSSQGLILLAEDNAINQMVAVDTLAMLGYEVDVARNGLEVLQLAGTRPYQAILMDCQMPKMDGFAATTELRALEKPNEHIPIIAMTAGALAEDRQHCLATGMDDYLAKPIDPDKLQAALNRWITHTTPSPPAPTTTQATNSKPST